MDHTVIFGDMLVCFIQSYIRRSTVCHVICILNNEIGPGLVYPKAVGSS